MKTANKTELTDKPVWRTVRSIGYISADEVSHACGWKPGDGELLEFIRRQRELANEALKQLLSAVPYNDEG